MSPSQLIIFLKKPAAGRVKTRLADTIGSEKAVELYLALIKHTFTEASKLAAQYEGGRIDVAVYADTAIERREEFPVEIPENFGLYVQQGEGLGTRMKNAFAEGFREGFKSQIIIGSDCPELVSGHLKQAFDAIRATDTVIGPARDGGYYLLGMKKLHPALFELQAWSHEKVFEQTLHRIRAHQLSYTQLEELSDVDTAEDLQRLGLS